MKTSTNLTTGVSGTTVSDTLRNSVNVVAVPELVLDWNFNRYFQPTANNTPSEDTDGFDIEVFPIESIYAPNRPTKGVNKAIVNQSVASSTYTSPGDVRFYVGDQDDVYKYWTSPVTTDGSATFPTHTDTFTKARPRVDYPTTLQANKIVVKFETTWAAPNDYNIQIKTSPAGSYADVGGASPTVDNLGVATLYYNGSAWVTTRPSTLVTTAVAGIQLVVRTMKGGTDRNGNPTTYLKKNYTLTGTPGSLTQFTTDGKNSNLSVIAIEAHLEVDMSNRLISESSQFDLSAESELYPIGEITSNSGSITLSNNDNVFDEQNASSPYYGLTKQNAEVNLRYIYTIGGVQHAVQQYKMYTGLWQHNDDGTVEVPLADFSKFFDETKPRAFMWESKSVSEIVWRICDSVGFVDYDISVSSTDFTIPVFWSDGTKTVWQLFDELAEASQTAIYLNSAGRLQVRTREAAFTDSLSPNVHLFGRDVSTTDLANIISLNPNDAVNANKITVTYRATAWKVGTDGKPALSAVWQPDNDVLVVRSTQLISNIINASTAFYVGQKDVQVWPYKSKVEIDGEIIQYDGKEYVYWTGLDGKTKNTIWVNSQDDIKAADKLTQTSFRNQNHLTGGLKITGRGLWNSDQRDHSVDANNWSTVAEQGGFFNNNTRGFKFNRTESTVTIDTPGFMNKADDVYRVYRGSTGQTGYKMYGTRFQFDRSGGGTQRGGIAVQTTGTAFNGYYIEVRTTGSIKDQDRKNTNEVMLYARTSTGWKIIDNGKPIAIKAPRWYDLDVYVSQGTQDRLVVFLNGQQVINATTTTPTKATDSARVAMYARGQTKINFEYFYGIAQPINEPIDGYGFWDLKSGAMRGGAWEAEHVWHKKGNNGRRRTKRNSTKKKTPYSGYLFDEFGPYVHEVREFDVKFDPAPVQYSNIYSTNNWEAATVEYVSDAFGAQFIISNVSRTNAILQGEDTLLFLGSDPVNQVCIVLGRDLISEDDAEITFKNDSAILVDGEVSVEMTSEWIQTKPMAEAVAKWMTKHWSKGVDQLTVNVFGNPLIEVGDIVDIDWPVKNFSPSTHKYFVLAVNTSFDSGITTSLTLRRVNYASDGSLT